MHTRRARPQEPRFETSFCPHCRILKATRSLLLDRKSSATTSVGERIWVKFSRTGPSSLGLSLFGILTRQPSPPPPLLVKGYPQVCTVHWRRNPSLCGGLIKGTDHGCEWLVVWTKRINIVGFCPREPFLIYDARLVENSLVSGMRRMVTSPLCTRTTTLLVRAVGRNTTLFYSSSILIFG